MITLETITYTWIDGGALIALEPILAANGWTSLNGKTARALVAHDGTKLAGFHILQMLPHAEPLYVAPEYRGTGVALELAARMDVFLEDISCRAFMVVADTPEAVHLCEAHGMKLITSPVYLKVGE